MTTLLQEVYDAFFIKSDENYSDKQDQVFQFFKTAQGKSKLTIKEDLSYIVYKDNATITVWDIISKDGNISLTINSNSYNINLLMTYSKLDIAKSIFNAIKNDWNVVLKNYENPMLIITKIGVDTITTSYNDIDNTEIDLSLGITYDGEFINTIDNQNIIELIALYMKKEEIRKQLSPLEKTKQYLGTKDFNKLPEKYDKYKTLQLSQKNIDDEIFQFRQELYSYSN